MTLKLITPPANEPMSLAEAKVHLRVDADLTQEDALITAFIKAAREHAEHITQRVFMPAVYEQVLDEFPASHICLDTAPVQSIQSVQYVDSLGDTLTVLGSEYLLDDAREPSWCLLGAGAAWPSAYGANSVRVRFVAGYAPLAADAATARAAVPESAKAWMRLAIGTMWRNRETFVQGPMAASIPDSYVDRLLDPLRLWGPT